jgi:hypothetical protein
MARQIATRLQLQAKFDLTPLVASLEQNGLLRHKPISKGRETWYATLNSCELSRKPSLIIESFLRPIESLEGENRDAWDKCDIRDLALLYGDDGERMVLISGVKNAHLHRIASAGLSLRILVGPIRPTSDPPDDPTAIEQLIAENE